jgi:NADPH-dependent F420 reductase
MKIAILGGTGSIGEGLALRWSNKHEIVICSREEEKAAKSADEYTGRLTKMGMTCCGITGCTNETGIKDADVVVLSVPYDSVVSLLKALEPNFKDQVVISLVVPMKKNKWFEYTPPKQGSAALEIREVLPKSVKVVSAYHNVPAKKLAQMDIILDYSVVICGDDEGSKNTVKELTREIKNLCPLDGGPLVSSYMIESMTPFLINLAIRNKLSYLGVKFL